MSRFLVNNFALSARTLNGIRLNIIAVMNFIRSDAKDSIFQDLFGMDVQRFIVSSLDSAASPFVTAYVTIITDMTLILVCFLAQFTYIYHM